MEPLYEDRFVPAGLLRPPPRNTRLRPAAQKDVRTGKLFRGVPLVIAGALALIVLFNLALNTLAPTWDGVITERRMVYIKGTPGNKSRNEWYLSYEYGLPGARWRALQKVGEPFYQEVREGAWKVRAWALSGWQVSMLEIPSSEFLHENFPWLIMGGFLSVFSGIIHLTFAPKMRRERLLVAMGMVAKGVIVAKPVFTSGPDWRLVSYEFRDHRGSVIRAKKNVSKIAFAQLTVGQEVFIVYFPENPKANLLYDYGWYEAVE